MASRKWFFATLAEEANGCAETVYDHLDTRARIATHNPGVEVVNELVVGPNDAIDGIKDQFDQIVYVFPLSVLCEEDHAYTERIDRFWYKPRILFFDDPANRPLCVCGVPRCVDTEAAQPRTTLWFWVALNHERTEYLCGR